MNPRDGYLPGVPCWLDIVQPEVDATMSFYGDLFGWTHEIRTPQEAPSRYAYAKLEGLLVAGVGGPPDTDPGGWTTYVWVDSVDDSAAAVTANGGRLLADAVDIPHAGRVAMCADPAGAVFGVWQAAENRGAQLVNSPGSWNFSELETSDPDRAEAFYAAVFGWQRDPFEIKAGEKAGIWRVQGYGDFLAASDPEIRRRQESQQAPAGFADAVALVKPNTAGSSGASDRWSVTFAVADADAAVARATDLGATVVTPLSDTEYTRQATIEDPQGARLTLSQYRPPAPSES